MRVFNRQCDEMQKDYQKMWLFLIDDYADKQDHFIWTIGRLGDWPNSLSGDCFFPSFIRNNAQLWFNSNEELIAFAISEYGTGEFYILARRGHEFLYHEIIEWVKTNWGNREGGLRTVVDEIQTQYTMILEKNDFKKVEGNEVTRQYDLQNMTLQEPILPGGIHIKDMFSCPNERGSILVGENAWHDKNEITKSHELRYKFRRENPCYFPHLDIYAETENGLVVANCNAFVDYKNNYAEIERVCSHRDFRRKGLAQTVIIECMKRLRDEGVKHAYIGGDYDASINLYGKFEFTQLRNCYPYAL